MIARTVRAGPGEAARASAPAALGLLLVLAALLASAPATAQEGQSLGVTPPEHVIEGAIDGEAYRRQVTVQNEFDSETTVSLDTSGEVGVWTTTDPASGFLVPPRTHSPIDLTIQIPQDTVNGTYTGKLHITAEPKEQPDGSGAAIRYSVAVLLEVQVGGDPVHDVRFTGGSAGDTEAGSPPSVEATVVNSGNVRETVQACASILPLSGGEPLERVQETAQVLPGERATLSFSFAEALPLGQYRVEIHAGCEEQDEPLSLGSEGTFKVVPPGTLGKDGILRFIEHAPRADVGRPVEVQGVFENTGKADIARATFTARIFQDDELVHVIETEPRVVPIGERVGLAGFFTPEDPGRYVIRGAVTYDGFSSQERESFLTVQGGSTVEGPTGWISTIGPIAGLGLLLVGAAVLLWRRRDPGDGSAEAADEQADELLEDADVELL